MLDRETMLTLFDTSIKSLVCNLDFIPADKLDWKPAPEAKSALEIVNHLAGFLSGVSNRLNGESLVLAPAANVDEAKQTLTQVAERYSAAVRDASADTLSEKFREEHEFTNGWIVPIAIFDTVHHHGQIAYIQTLLGDNEIHGDPSAAAHFIIN